MSPHVTFCGVYYQTTQAKDGEQELRVDVQVIYLPILHVKMPTDGVVTVTGYGTTSLMDPLQRSHLGRADAPPSAHVAHRDLEV